MSERLHESLVNIYIGKFIISINIEREDQFILRVSLFNLLKIISFNLDLIE